MKTNLAHRDDVMTEEETIGHLVESQTCLCISADCPIETVLAMMSNMETRVAAVINPGNVFQGLVNRSSILGGLIIHGNFDVGSAIDTSQLKRLKAADVMITSTSFLTSELSVRDALEIMAEYGYSTMPVLKENAQFVGIAEMRDLVAAQNNDPRDALMSFLADKSHDAHSLSRH